MAGIKICAIFVLTLYNSVPLVSMSETPNFDTFLQRQIKQVTTYDYSKIKPDVFIMQAELALFSTGKLLTVIDWAYETNLTDTNRNSKTAFKVYIYSYETSIKNSY